MYYNGTMKDVNSSTTTLTFTAPSLPDGVFSGTVVVMVTAVNRFGVGPASDPEIVVINGMYVYMCVCILCLHLHRKKQNSLCRYTQYVHTFLHKLLLGIVKYCITTLVTSSYSRSPN